MALFPAMNADDMVHDVTEIESCCMNCFENGTTRLLLTKIPFYKEVIVMSFSCDHCGFSNNELQSGAETAAKGCRITLNVKSIKDLNRRIVKSDYTSVKFVECDFEIPAQSQRGEVTTIEGILDRAIKGLEQDQTKRSIEHPDDAKQIDKFVQSLIQLKSVDTPFTVIFEDISGNSYVENPNAPHTDSECITKYFGRTTAQNQLLGIFTQEEIHKTTETENSGSLLKPIAEDSWPLEELHGEVFQFATPCPECKAPCETNMKVTSIPHFKDVVIMATCCDVCGCKTNEVKSGGGIELQGVKFEVHISCKDDMSRDVLKSDTCSLQIPELDCEAGASTLSGRFTTVEGILEAVKDQLSESGPMFHDSEDKEAKLNMKKFVNELNATIAGKRSLTLILDDPAGNSYVQSLADDNDIDDRLFITKYERSHDQNEDLGLNDMKTDNY